MGSCAVFEKSLQEIRQENNNLSNSNIQLLKFLSLYYAEKKQSGMAVKMINIKLITKNYYHSVATEREKTFSMKSLFDQEQCNLLEEVLLKENTELMKANKVLHKIYSSLTARTLSFAPSVDKKLSEYYQNTEVLYRYEELKSRCIDCNNNGSGIGSLCYRLNNGLVLPKEHTKILRHVSKVTSHIANNPQRRITYPFDGPANGLRRPVPYPRRKDAKGRTEIPRNKRYLTTENSQRSESKVLK